MEWTWNNVGDFKGRECIVEAYLELSQVSMIELFDEYS